MIEVVESDGEWSDLEDSTFESYPVKRSEKGKNRAKPYEPRKQIPQDKTIEIERNQPMEDVPRSEGINEEKLRKSKSYRFDAWDTVKRLPVPITLQDLAQLSPTVKQQI